MPTLFVTDLSGVELQVVGQTGMSLMENIRNNSFDDLLAICGGQCSCATCHVFVDDEFLARLPAMSADENELLGSTSARRPNSRLSCQVPFAEALDGLRVAIAPEG